MSDGAQEAEYRPFIRFEDQSASFVHGYQCGLIGAEMERGASVGPCMVNPETRPTLEEMANAYGYEPTFEETVYSEWLQFSAEPARKGLRAIDGGRDV